MTEHDDQADEAEPETTGPQPDPETLVTLRARSDKLGAQLISLNDKAAKVAGQVEDLDAARIEALAGGGDSARFARQRADLEAEHARITQDANVVGGWLAECDGEIATREATIETTQKLAEARRVWREARAMRDTVYGRSGDRQRAAIAAVMAAAEDYTRVPADEAEADRAAAEAHAAVAALCEQLGQAVPPVPVPPASTHMRVPGDAMAGAPLALLQANSAARRGDARTVAAKLGEAFGWAPGPPPSPEEIAAGQHAYAAMLKRNRQIRAGIRPLDPQLQHSASVGLDEHGNPLRRPLPPHPRDSYAAPMLTGWLGFQPWPQ